ncbi:MAG: tRNA preQ1(34) S-adenosylmethionine ribosyltransferase-isomerase QueA [Lachnospiraceae bacterium]|nr:tRNA preQ1(34) S-adenosylmethionine ribosyltransferase-isomerase QueA [Lachnospiraceae bacterium]
MCENIKTSDYYYDLPKELIAQDPIEDRSASRMMVLNRKTGEFCHSSFKEITELLEAGDCLVLNDTKVIPARLLGSKEDTLAGIEVFLLKRLSDTDWECLVRPGKKLKPGARVSFGDGLLKGEIIDYKEDGNRIVRFEYQGVFEEILSSLGEMPLPPYITHKLKDKNRYQTVYAKNEGSAAAPTAGLHFTKDILDQIEAKGVKVTYITLHVGLGTFRPVKCDNILEHHMHSEHYRITKEVADTINRVKANGHRVICVGTTSLRTLESAADPDGLIRAKDDDTDIFIYPGYNFKITDGLITNFHLPESTLIMLVSAFAGKDNVFKAYEAAIEEKYRFFSFGDCMAIL